MHFEAAGSPLGRERVDAREVREPFAPALEEL